MDRKARLALDKWLYVADEYEDEDYEDEDDYEDDEDEEEEYVGRPWHW